MGQDPRQIPEAAVLRKPAPFGLILALMAPIAMVACTRAADEKGAEKAAPAAAKPEKATPATTEAQKPEAPLPMAPDGALAFNQENGRIVFLGKKVIKTKAQGDFAGFVGWVRVDGEDVKEVQVAIDTTTTRTANGKLTRHLLSDDFFAAKKHPWATFSSKSIRAQKGEGGATHLVTGELTIRGIKKAITFPATLSLGEAEHTLSAVFEINRKEFNILYPGGADNLIVDEVQITLDLKVPASKA
jgi:polyisoprenoid-binding protein YceI